MNCNECNDDASLICERECGGSGAPRDDRKQQVAQDEFLMWLSVDRLKAKNSRFKSFIVFVQSYGWQHF